MSSEEELPTVDQPFTLQPDESIWQGYLRRGDKIAVLFNGYYGAFGISKQMETMVEGWYRPELGIRNPYDWKENDKYEEEDEQERQRDRELGEFGQFEKRRNPYIIKAMLEFGCARFNRYRNTDLCLEWIPSRYHACWCIEEYDGMERLVIKQEKVVFAELRRTRVEQLERMSREELLAKVKEWKEFVEDAEKDGSSEVEESGIDRVSIEQLPSTGAGHSVTPTKPR